MIITFHYFITFLKIRIISYRSYIMEVFLKRFVATRRVETENESVTSARSRHR